MDTAKPWSIRKQPIVYTGFLLLMLVASCHSKRKNHLSDSASPYLREHADNPVEWYEWSNEALQLAKKEDKPLLISVGYSACHWCHVMEKESFMDTAVARIMNDNFVCIKVDKEERPDIDGIYTDACQLISGRSGWPLQAFALPDGKPFFAGTYYAKQSWISLLKQVASAYHTQKNKVVLQAQTLSRGIANIEFSVLADSSIQIFDKTASQTLFERIYKKIDASYGGLKGTPKFPPPSIVEYLLQYYFLTKDKRALDAATTTLSKMALGGIYDQIRGGFARYAVDSLWHVPHFEKMLYDNAQLLSVYAHAYQLTKNDFFKSIVQETADFIQSELYHPDGGYYSSLDADTKQGEGEFYTWRADELKRYLPHNFRQIADYYNISEEGNWKKEKNVLFSYTIPELFAQKNNIRPDLFSSQLSVAKRVLLTKRNKRERPSADEKILTSWNALLINGYLDAYAALGNAVFLQRALSTARFLENNLFQKNGMLWRNFRDGKASTDAFLDDYAFLARAYIRLYQLTFDKQWLVRSKQLADIAIAKFYDVKSGMFFYSANQTSNAITKQIKIADNGTPSPNSAIACVLYTLSVYFENTDYLNKSARMLSRLYQQLDNGETYSFASWCFLANMFAYGTQEVAIMGKDAPGKNQELQRNYLPLSIFMGSTQDENLPLLKGKNKESQTLIYVCTNRTCKRPVEETGAALDQLVHSF